jgi:predicted GH43/DUF377 family glycosyl hydrolase
MKTPPRLWTRRLLAPEDVPPSRGDFETIGAFNPGAVRVGDEVVLLIRVAERPRAERPGWIGLPRWDADSESTVVDWVRSDEVEPIDPRVVRRRSDGRVRLTFLSHLRVARCGLDGDLRSLGPATFGPAGPLEEFGVEDPRITPLDGRFYFTYVAVSRHGPATALASTVDFASFERHGTIFCPENKDVVLFPERIRGEYAALHRPVCGTPFTPPEMWTARSPDLRHWGSHEPLVVEGGAWQAARVGAGPPPVRAPEGWLLVYHGKRPSERPGDVGEYCAGAVLLDAAAPTHVLRSGGGPFFVPSEEFEIRGFVPRVVFPTGAAVAGSSLLLFYGAADACTGVAAYALPEILAATAGVDARD